MNKRHIQAATFLLFALSVSPVLAQTASANFSQGNAIMVVANINVREGANGAVIGQQPTGAKGTLVGGPVVTNGYTWWNVNYDNGTDGWSAEDFMQSPKVALQTSKQSGTPIAKAMPANQFAAAGSVGASSLESLRQQLLDMLARLASFVR